MLTARGNETDRVVGLEIGADDYVTKPYSLRELVARIKAILRRTSQEKDFLLPNKATLAVRSQIIRRGALELDYTSRTCCYHGDFLSLTATEFEMLWLFVSRPGQVLTREQLLDSVRGREFEIFDRSIDVHVSKLRKKLEDDPKHPQLIHTVWGVGYRFVSPE
jgi:DNA-binding response OmpR family regulator